MRGIVLAGGRGTRLYPATKVVSKQLLPIFDKPMVYYPLSVLMMAGIREILILSTPEDLPRLRDLLGDGSLLGLRLSYRVQETPRGIADAFLVGASFIQDQPVALILGDNLFYGPGLSQLVQKGAQCRSGGVIFAYQVRDPRAYGVVAFDAKMEVISVEEKPQSPQSSYAVPGLYFYGPEVVDFARCLKPSPRGELEITEIHQELLRQGKLRVEVLGRGYAWLDMGTFEALHQASAFVQTVQERQGIQVACIEEVAYRMGWITREDLLSLGGALEKNAYREYVLRVASEVF